ncbi:DUF4097 domain-containing protein [Streptomyces sp. NBC_00249]|uniref:DUF4097 family beta strand repeat-containing protein n=1 Tax=Streptomyces sp. NBC_00249 TaxID=2975690 RepID=UPI00225AA3BF|nr:DUF4097 family beta strand repeat-containing protein [Streptomyces sp. NBC_00249]MCX5194420.1 DUF4097 domain-containing protein [Streptomyces sp. NBC_00249]
MASHTTSLVRTALGATALAGVLLVSGCSFAEEGRMRTASADATVAGAVTAVELTGVRRGSVEVTPGSGPGVVVHRTVHYRGDRTPTPGQQVSHGVLTFSEGCADTCWTDYRLEVPASAKVKVGNSSGRITVTGVAAAELDSDSGDVRAERIAGPLKVRTSSGDITGTALNGPEAEVRSGSGNATLGFTRAPDSVSVTATSGDVTLKVPGAGPYRVDASSTSGDRDITVPVAPEARAALAVRTTSGDIRVSAP